MVLYAGTGMAQMAMVCLISSPKVARAQDPDVNDLEFPLVPAKGGVCLCQAFIRDGSVVGEWVLVPWGLLRLIRRLWPSISWRPMSNG